MRLVTVVTNRSGAARRFKCTCGHCEDVKDDGQTPLPKPEDPLVLDGFEQTL